MSTKVIRGIHKYRKYISNNEHKIINTGNNLLLDVSTSSNNNYVETIIFDTILFQDADPTIILPSKVHNIIIKDGDVRYYKFDEENDIEKIKLINTRIAGNVTIPNGCLKFKCTNCGNITGFTGYAKKMTINYCHGLLQKGRQNNIYGRDRLPERDVYNVDGEYIFEHIIIPEGCEHFILKQGYGVRSISGSASKIEIYGSEYREPSICTNRDYDLCMQQDGSRLNINPKTELPDGCDEIIWRKHV